MNIKEDLTCKYCNQIYTDPVSLICCGENVCKKHIDKIFSKQATRSLKCPLCDSDLPNQTFQINKSLKSLLEREIHKLKIDPESENLMSKFKASIQNIVSINNDPENLIHEKISELKRQVDLDREKINLLADELIKKLDSYENEFKKDCKTGSNQEYYNHLVDNMKTQLNEYEKYFKSLNNTTEDIKNKNKEVEYAITYFGKEIKEYENKLFKNKRINYEPMKGDFVNVFGKLAVKITENSWEIKYKLDHFRSNVNALTCFENMFLACGCDNDDIKIWNLNDRTLVKTLAARHIYSLKYLGNNQLASGSGDKTIKIWNTNDENLIRTLEGHQSAVNGLACLENNVLISSSIDKMIKIWDFTDGRLIRTLAGHTDCIWSLTYIEKGYFASGSLDSSIILWNINDENFMKKLKRHTGRVCALVNIENGCFASAGDDKKIKIWNAEEGKLIKTIVGHEDGVLSLAYLGNDSLASGSRDGSIRIWTIKNSKCTRVIQTGKGNLVMALEKIGNHFFACGVGRIDSSLCFETIKIFNI